MRVPISWLKDYTNIKLNLPDLMWKMTEAGLTCESYEKVGSNIVLNVEVTPNRPDWLSITGIAREITAIQNSKIKLPEIKDLPVKKSNLPIKVSNDYKLCPRYSGITISGVKVKPSPSWLQERLKLVGLRPINNLVDITNYVMFELGNPIHVFDYDKFTPSAISLCLSKSGEKFVSVDEKNYVLPKNAIIFKNKNRVVDLCGIKGGLNSGVSENTKNIFIHVAVYNGALIRRTSQALGLSSEASYIFERGANSGGTVDALTRTVNLVLELAGGQIASDLIDMKMAKFEPRELILSLNKLKKVLGIEIPEKDVLSTLGRLNLSPSKKGESIHCTIPTYRADLKIEEDLIEEVARIWGYNNFPKTLPTGSNTLIKVPFYYDRKFELKLKEILVASGYSETITLSLVSADSINQSRLNLDTHIKIANSVSREYEYLRTSLVPNLLSALKLNTQEKVLKLFEYGKIHLGPLDGRKELYKLTAIEKNTSFRSIKGTIDLLLDRLNISSIDIKQTLVTQGLLHPTKSGVIEIKEEELGRFGQIHPKVLDNFSIKEKIFVFELDVQTLRSLTTKRPFQNVPKYPAQIEDLTLVFPEKTRVGEVVNSIRMADKLISRVELKDIFKDAYTFRVWYQHPEKTLTDDEIRKLRKKILENLSKKFGVTIK